MAIDPQWIIVAVVAVAVLIAALLITSGMRRSRSAALRDKFGREYDHAVTEKGSRRRAENELLARAEEVKSFDIRPLSASERGRYHDEWKRVETHFVERPAMAVAEADELVADIMRVTGYPMGDFERHAAHLSVTHPRVVDHYRAGHKVMTGAPGSASTEDLRQAMLHYRALFTELIGEAGGGRDVARDLPRENEVTATPRATGRDGIPDDQERVRDGRDDVRDDRDGIRGDDLFTRR